MGEAGVTVNVVSNLKLGAGVAPVRRLIQVGVMIALGTDGMSSSDTASIFDVMRVAGLLHGAPGEAVIETLGAQEHSQRTTHPKDHCAGVYQIGDV